MQRRLLVLLLALGTVGGYASGFASLACHHRHAAFERHAGLCASAHEDALTRGPCPR